MALELDGIAVLGGVAKHPDAFPDIAIDARKAARALVVKQLKAKGTDLSRLRAICRALGGEFPLLVDGLSDAEVKSLTAKFDKFHPDLATGPNHERRQHLMALADGSIEPALKPITPVKSKPPSTKKPAKDAPLERLSSKAAAAVRKPRHVG
jgi:hypothetical protein